MLSHLFVINGATSKDEVLFGLFVMDNVTKKRSVTPRFCFTLRNNILKNEQN